MELVGVQHHHAHLAACLAEHGVTAPAVGAIFDGTGLGADGTVWGGELLVGDLRGYERAGWLWPVRMPGGAAAVRQPWRMAAAWLAAALGPRAAGARPRSPGRVSPADWEAVGQIGRAPELSPLTSSIGRLFDAVGVLCGAPARVSYEGRRRSSSRRSLDRPARPALRRLDTGGHARRRSVRARSRARRSPSWRVTSSAGCRPRSCRRAFTPASPPRPSSAVTAIASARGAGDRGPVRRRVPEPDAAGGRRGGAGRAPACGCSCPERLPPNDGGISFGQAAVAAAQ